MAKRKIVDARADSLGNIESVRLEGNSNFTSLATAMRMADRGEIEGAHTVYARDKKYTLGQIRIGLLPIIWMRWPEIVNCRFVRILTLG